MSKGWKHTEEWKENLSKSMMGVNNPNYGKHWSEEVHRLVRNKKEDPHMFRGKGKAGLTPELEQVLMSI